MLQAYRPLQQIIKSCDRLDLLDALCLHRKLHATQDNIRQIINSIYYFLLVVFCMLPLTGDFIFAQFFLLLCFTCSRSVAFTVALGDEIATFLSSWPCGLFRPVIFSYRPCLSSKWFADWLRRPTVGLQLVAWHSGRTSVSGRQTFPVLRSTCS